MSRWCSHTIDEQAVEWVVKEHIYMELNSCERRVVMRRLAHLQMSEVADILGITRQAVRTAWLAMDEQDARSQEPKY